MVWCLCLFHQGASFFDHLQTQSQIPEIENAENNWKWCGFCGVEVNVLQTVKLFRTRTHLNKLVSLNTEQKSVTTLKELSFKMLVKTTAKRKKDIHKKKPKKVEPYIFSSESCDQKVYWWREDVKSDDVNHIFCNLPVGLWKMWKWTHEHNN